jgi:hypothetical protein
VGTGSLAKDGSNKKYCGWTREGIQMYNNFLKRVKENCRADWAHDVEAQVFDALKIWDNDQETQRHTLAVHPHRKKKQMSDDYESNENECGLDINAYNDLTIAFT